MGWSTIIDIINKILPSRKAAAVAKLNELTAQYQKALQNGEDTKASELRVQLRQLRKELGYTDGDI